MKRLIDVIWHRIRKYEWIPAEDVNGETGTCDFYCTCPVCKWTGRHD